MAKSININHSNSSITTSDGSYIELTQNGVVKIGTGLHVEDDIINSTDAEILKKYEGSLRFNPDTKKIEYCNGSRWVELVIDIDVENNNTSMIYSMLF